MNQILVSEKLYVTPELKKKKKLFKMEFILSVFLLCVLSTYGIYAEYDRNKSEEVGREILGTISFPEETTETVTEESIIIILNSEEMKAYSVTTETEVEIEVPEEQISIASDGTEYYTLGIIQIPEINVDYPILSTATTELLKISVCKLWGPKLNEVGNFCIVGHNYRNNKFFSKVPALENGTQIMVTDLSGKVLTYEVYDKYVVSPSETACTSQETDGRKEITLITCTNDNKNRVVVKAREVV